MALAMPPHPGWPARSRPVRSTSTDVPSLAQVEARVDSFTCGTQATPYIRANAFGPLHGADPLHRPLRRCLHIVPNQRPTFDEVVAELPAILAAS